MNKVSEKSLATWPLSYFFSAMQSFCDRSMNVETATQRYLENTQQLYTLYLAFDTAYKHSSKSQLTEQIDQTDTIRDAYAYMVEKISNIWAEKLKTIDNDLAVKGRRVHQPFVDFEFSTSEAMTSENAKLDNIFEVFDTPLVTQDIADLGLTEIVLRLKQKTARLKNLITQRNQDMSGIEKGEVKSTRDALYNHYVAFVKYINALQEIAPEEGISEMAQYYNADLENLERQMKQSKKNPSVLVKSVIVGNHRYTVPEFSKWSDIAAANAKDFTIDTANNRLLSALNKAKKVGGLYLALKGMTVKPTDVVDAKKEYTLLLMDGTEPQPEPDDEGGGEDVTPVTPE